ncbi:MAG: hypothetical protein ACLQRH_27370 [Acidimicrobiales bacterium]
MLTADGFTYADVIGNRGLNLAPDPLPTGRERHKYGDGPFARLTMPALPRQPGLYLWDLGGTIMYVGKTRTSLSGRLGSRGYATISNYNTFAPQRGRKRGQQTNCMVHALANAALTDGHGLSIWFRVTEAAEAGAGEARWMRMSGKPDWNLRHERER